VSSETAGWLEELHPRHLTAASLADLELTIANAVASLVGGRYKAKIDSLEFDMNALLREKAKLTLKLERTGSDLPDESAEASVGSKGLSGCSALDDKSI